MSGHGGDIFSASVQSGLAPEAILDFSANINPLGPPPSVCDALSRAVDGSGPGASSAVSRYPDPHCRRLRARLGEVYGTGPDRLLIGNGATELIYLAMRALRPSRVAVFAPCYMDYWRAAEQVGAEVNGFVTAPESGFKPSAEALDSAAAISDVVWVGHPNNPSGWMLERDQILAVAARRPEVMFLVDESFTEFVQEAASHTLLRADAPANVLVVRSLTKVFAIPGLRLGLAAGHPEVLRPLARIKEPWTVNALAQEAGMVLYDDEDYLRRTRIHTALERRFLASELASVPGLVPFDSAGPFLLVRITVPGWSSTRLHKELLRGGVLIRDASDFRGLDASYVRFAVRGRDDNVRLLSVLRETLGVGTPEALAAAGRSEPGSAAQPSAAGRDLV